MIYRQLDDNGDYIFGRGKHAYLEGVDAVAQAIKTRLLLLYHEWWEDLEDGLPLWEKIMASSGQPSNIKAVDFIFRERIQGTTGVLSILGYESSFENRHYTFRCAVETLYGSIVISNIRNEAEG